MKTLTILGSTGSIGTQALDVVRSYPEEFKIKCLCCGSNTALLQKQIDEFRPEIVAVEDETAARKLKRGEYRLIVGKDAARAAAAEGADVTLNALVGISGLLPTAAAIEAGSDIALANKETLVAGGEAITALAAEKGVKLLPVDSEHSAIWQCLNRRAEDAAGCSSLILTASGGPFRGRTREQIADATLEQALKHPTWNMGVKVTVDSATMMNKGFEIIEAMHLFGVPADRIEVVVHRQSVVHSMIAFADGSIIAQMSYPDMRLPIELALLYPKRGDRCFSPLSFDALSLDFEKPDTDTFECLDLARQCAQKGGLYPAVLNAANEVLVDKFAKGIIKFGRIPYHIKEALDAFPSGGDSRSLEDVLALDREVKAFVSMRTETTV